MRVNGKFAKPNLLNILVFSKLPPNISWAKLSPTSNSHRYHRQYPLPASFASIAYSLASFLRQYSLPECLHPSPVSLACILRQYYLPVSLASISRQYPMAVFLASIPCHCQYSTNEFRFIADITITNGIVFAIFSA